MSPMVIHTADLLARTGACALLLLLAGVTARDQGRRPAGWLGAAFALGSAAFAFCSFAGFHNHPRAWAAPILALAAGDNLVFWLFARALFDDGFRLRAWHAGAWGAVVGLDWLLAYGLEPAGSPLAAWIHGLLSLSALGFAVLAVAQTLATWGEDLVEPRRRIRPFVVGAAAAFITVTALVNLAQASGRPSPVLSLAQGLGLLAIVTVAAWSLLRAEDGEGLFASAQPAAPAPAPREASAPGPADAALVASLEHTLRVERIYRQEGLTIAELARRQGLPEHRLRRLINQGLGHRNFNSFLNGYRLAEAMAALADPAQAQVPILTIALDAGFGSLGPFNRAFKAETGRTPTEFRRRPDGAGEVVSISASRISKSA
jgi:AraC-like DNA-binding protein